MKEPINFHFDNGNNAAGYKNFSQSGHTTGTPLKGLFQGEEVTPRSVEKSPTSDAAEELSFTGANRDRKELFNRKAKDALSTGNEKRASLLAEFYREKLPDLNWQKLQEFFESIKQGEFTPDELAQKAINTFPDVSHQFAALTYSGQRLEEENADAFLISTINKTANNLRALSGPDILAGLNISSTARKYETKDFGELQSLREFYRETIVHSQDLEDTYKSIFKRYGQMKFSRAVEFLIATAGSELRSQNRSVSGARLKSVIDELYWLKVISGLHKDCSWLLKKMNNQFAEIDLKTTGEELMENIFTFKANQYLQSNSIVRMIDKFGIVNQVADNYFLRELNKIIDGLPEKVFPDNDTRQNMITAFREAMDTVIDKELEKA